MFRRGRVRLGMSLAVRNALTKVGLYRLEYRDFGEGNLLEKP